MSTAPHNTPLRTGTTRLHRLFPLIAAAVVLFSAFEGEGGCRNDGPVDGGVVTTGFPGTWILTSSSSPNDASYVESASLTLKSDSTFTATHGFFVDIDSIRSRPLGGRWKTLKVIGQPAGTATMDIIEFTTKEMSIYYKLGSEGAPSGSMQWYDGATGTLRYAWRRYR